MESKTHHIDLQDFKSPQNKMYNTRSWGIVMRNASRIDYIEPHYEEIVIHFPSDITEINTPFLEEFLENVVVRLGENNFRKKFKFEYKSNYKIDSYLNDAITRVLRTPFAAVY